MDKLVLSPGKTSLADIVRIVETEQLEITIDRDAKPAVRYIATDIERAANLISSQLLKTVETSVAMPTLS